MPHQVTSRYILHNKVDSILCLETTMQIQQNGCISLLAVKNTRFSDLTLSASSFSTMKSFFNTLMAHNFRVCLDSANITLPKFPLPKTAKNWKSSNPTFLLRRLDLPDFPEE